jgi:hypothetical protein
VNECCTAWGIPAARPDRRMNESGPSALYRQHHDVEAPSVDERHFRPAWRVLTRLDGLLADKAITAAEWHAAADYRELWGVSHATLIGSSIGRASIGTAGHQAFDVSLAGELDALARLREVRRALGAWPCTLLYLSVVRDRHGPRSRGTIAAIRKPRALG